MKTITTHASAATVYRWATQGSKRLRAKYRHAETVCLVINRREAPIMGLDPKGNYGVVGNLKMGWGYGHVRECGPEDRRYRSMRFPARWGPPWENTESMAVYRRHMSPDAWKHVLRGPYRDTTAVILAAQASGQFVPGSVSFDAEANTLSAVLWGTVRDVVIKGLIKP